MAIHCEISPRNLWLSIVVSVCQRVTHTYIIYTYIHMCDTNMFINICIHKHLISLQTWHLRKCIAAPSLPLLRQAKKSRSTWRSTPGCLERWVFFYVSVHQHVTWTRRRPEAVVESAENAETPKNEPGFCWMFLVETHLPSPCLDVCGVYVSCGVTNCLVGCRLFFLECAAHRNPGTQC